MTHRMIGRAVALLLVLGYTQGQVRYFGKDLGRLSSLEHGVSGRVFAVDSRTLYIQDLTYDGEGPSAYFYVGTSKSPHSTGATRLRDERGATGPLRKYRGDSVTVSLPEGMTLKDIKWFSIYCDEYEVDFGNVKLPRDLDFPKPARLGALRGVHGVSSDNVVVVDAQTLLVPNFSYDGEAPDAKFWVGRGDKPSPQGVKIPDENGKEAPLRRYDRKTIVLTLPGELTVFDIGHFAVWCEAFTVNFGHVTIPRQQISNVPPSLKMLGVSPQSKLNCEVLQDDLAFEVRWAVAGDSIVLQLVAKLEDGEYMSFGVSGDDTHSQMVGADVAVAWLDKTTLKGYAHDYYLDAKSQCAGVRGSCPDERLGEKTNSIRLLNAALVNGYSIVTYQRSLRAADELDRHILTNASQPIVWAVGPLNSKNEVSYHSHFLKGDKLLEFGRPPVWNCPMPESEEKPEQEVSSPQPQKEELTTAVIKPKPVPPPKPVPKVEPWEIPAIQCYEPADGVFYAQMGPTGGKQGYSAITGHVGWGISWYVNGLLIPEINVVRGKKYTFVVEGGSDPSQPARYHPFYITNDPVGGYHHKSEEEKKGVVIYAGVRRSRNHDVIPTGVGRLCNWTPDTQGPEADEYPSFGAYQRSLTLVCEEGNPGVVTWTPDENTPDTVYYQCYTHRHLGWKINVVDECDETEAEESQVHSVAVLPDDDLLKGEESIQVPSRIKPDTNFLLDQSKKVQKIINTNHNYNDFSNKDTGDEHRQLTRPTADIVDHDAPISNAQLKEVIQAAEILETKVKEEYNRNYTNQQEKKPMFVPEQPIRESDEYTVDSKVPNFMLAPNQNHKPLTLQSVLRPGMNGGKMPMGGRPPYRRPVPPEIKLRRPVYPKMPSYPLPMPNPHGPYNGPMKKPYGKPNGPNRNPNHNGPNSPFGPNEQFSPNRQMPPKMQNGQFRPNGQKPPGGPQFPLGGPYNIEEKESQDQQVSSSNKQNGPIRHLQPYNMNRPPTPSMPPQSIPPMKAMPPLGPSPVYPPQEQPKGINKIPSGPVQSIIMGKPSGILPPQSQTLSLGKSDIIANQIVKSQIVLPSSMEPEGQQSLPQTYLNIPGQIILGKPMENPEPLDQQMIPTKYHSVVKAPVTFAPEYQQTGLRLKSDSNRPAPTQEDIVSSDFISESNEPQIAPAKNTGFKPSSIVIESGFKPIIREPLMASEDRIADFSDYNPNRREDTDIEEDYESAPQFINKQPLAPVVPSDRMTESFEPMFIPSPEDNISPIVDDKLVTKEVFPSNHAKEDRPHPVYVPSRSDENNSLFSKKNMEKNVTSDLAVESDRVSPQYLPPPQNKATNQKLKNAEKTFTTYDGKTVSAVSLTSVPDVPQIPNNPLTKKLTPNKLPEIFNTPQFGTFRGELPPELLSTPLNVAPPKDDPAIALLNKTTKLKLVNTFKDKDEMVAAGSENDEVKVNLEEQEYDEEEYEDEEEKSEDSRRRKRETRTTQFEAGDPEETLTMESSAQTSSQVEFESHSESGSAVLQCSSVLSTVLIVILMY